MIESNVDGLEACGRATTVAGVDEPCDEKFNAGIRIRRPRDRNRDDQTKWVDKNQTCEPRLGQWSLCTNENNTCPESDNFQCDMEINKADAIEDFD